MTEKFLKFINKSPYKEVLLKIIKDIKANNLSGYDIKPYKGNKGAYRIRKGDVRILFRKQGEKIIIMKVDNRGDVYK